MRMAPFHDSKKWLHATVDSRQQSARSYVVGRDGKRYRRNKRHLRLSTIGTDLLRARIGPAISIERPIDKKCESYSMSSYITRPGRRSESNARTICTAPNDQTPRPVRPECQKPPEPMVARTDPGSSLAAPLGASVPITANVTTDCNRRCRPE